MFRNDYILREIENICKSLTNTFFKRDFSIFEAVNEQGTFSETGFFYHRLKKMIYDGKINEAEDLLFEEIEENPTEDNLKLSIQFYKDLHDLSDETLLKCNFSRQEILEGLDAIKNLYAKS